MAVAEMGIRTDDIPAVFGSRELAQILGIGESTARELMRRADFPVIAVTPRKRRVYKPQFLAWLEAQQKGMNVSALAPDR